MTDHFIYWYCESHVGIMKKRIRIMIL